MLVASRTLITPDSEPERPSQVLWLGYREQTESWGHISLCSVLITPP